jgi:RNA polymerase sigma-70 factor (ECF subfamily)
MSPAAVSEELLQKAQEGDQAAFDALLGPYLPTLRRFANAFARSSSDAEDIVQETLLRANRSLPSYRSESSLSTWLYTLTRHAGIDWYRKKQHREQPEEFEKEPITQDGRGRPDALLNSKDQVDLLYHAIQELPPIFRVPLILCEMEGLPYEDVAAIEGVPTGTVRSRLNRARKHLADLMGNVERLEAALSDDEGAPSA